MQNASGLQYIKYICNLVCALEIEIFLDVSVAVDGIR